MLFYKSVTYIPTDGDAISRIWTDQPTDGPALLQTGDALLHFDTTKYASRYLTMNHGTTHGVN